MTNLFNVKRISCACARLKIQMPCDFSPSKSYKPLIRNLNDVRKALSGHKWLFSLFRAHYYIFSPFFYLLFPSVHSRSLYCFVFCTIPAGSFSGKLLPQLPNQSLHFSYSRPCSGTFLTCFLLAPTLTHLTPIPPHILSTSMSNFPSPHTSTLKIEAAQSSETLISSHQNTRRKDPQNFKFHLHRRENFKSRKEWFN
jgi:hypothetical protein